MTSMRSIRKGREGKVHKFMYYHHPSSLTHSFYLFSFLPSFFLYFIHSSFLSFFLSLLSSFLCFNVFWPLAAENNEEILLLSTMDCQKL